MFDSASTNSVYATKSRCDACFVSSCGSVLEWGFDISTLQEVEKTLRLEKLDLFLVVKMMNIEKLSATILLERV